MILIITKYELKNEDSLKIPSRTRAEPELFRITGSNIQKKINKLDILLWMVIKHVILVLYYLTVFFGWIARLS